MLLMLNPSNNLGFALREDLLCIPINTLIVEQILLWWSGNTGSFQLQMRIVFILILFVLLLLFLVIRVINKAWVNILLMLFLCYGIFLGMNGLMHLFIIIKTPLWLENSLLNLQVLEKHEFPVMHTNYKMCRIYTKEETAALTDYLITLFVNQILDSYKDIEIPVGFREYLARSLILSFQHTLGSSLKVNSVKGLISVISNLCQQLLLKDDVKEMVKMYAREKKKG